MLIRSTMLSMALLTGPLLLSSGPTRAQFCGDSCNSARDGECDDGGPGALYSICGYGTDCADCGRRPALDPAAIAAQQYAGGCSDYCGSAHDGECDDGGPASLYSICVYGSDCSDCGTRPPTSAAALGRAPSATGCTNTCRTAFDSECDDGGTGSMFDVCALGTDCDDCGSRTPAGIGTAPPPTGISPPSGGLVPNGSLCLNHCQWANDGECDDGGPSSLYATCDFGSDCKDCGPRIHPGGVATPAALAAPPMGAAPRPDSTLGLTCLDSCVYARDGECDDGGPGSLYDSCALGSDCSDCGPRDATAPVPTPSAVQPPPTPPSAPVPSATPSFLSPPSSPPPSGPSEPSGGAVCGNSCPTARDDVCDDGGRGSSGPGCQYGTDCADCGPRTPQAR